MSKMYVIFLKMLENKYKDEVFNLALQNIKIIDLAHLIKSYFKDTNVDIIQTNDDQDKRNYNVDYKKMLKRRNLNQVIQSKKE